MVANLDMEIAKRQKHQALRRLEVEFPQIKIKEVNLPSPAKGTCLLLLGEFADSSCCYFALGERGKRAEIVADEAVGAFQAYLASGAAIDQYLADQLLLPLSFAPAGSELSTARITQHLLTNAEVLRLFLPIEINIQGKAGFPGTVRINPLK